jgi:hypothetical protein
MKKLFVDDIRSAPDDTWNIARTVTDAISAIEIFDFEVIALDHDISHQIIMGDMSRPYQCAETFVPVAQYIALKYRDAAKRPKIIIHTANPAGAIRLAGHLQQFEIERKHLTPANRLETIL